MEKTSPLKGRPLRLAGQSLQEQIDKLINEKAIDFILFPAFFFAMAIYEWIKYLTDSPPSPKALTLLFFIAAGIAAYKLIRLRKKVKQMRLGLDGEKAVGQYLEQLRQEGCSVFHDIIGDNFNIDHVVVSDKGIFLIETKTYSKPNTVNPRVRYTKSSLNIDGLGDMSKIITQVQASSTWLKRMLEESTGKKFLVKPVILFPGWYVESPDDAAIWVLEPKQFPHHLNKKQDLLSREDKKLAAFHLSRYIRTL